MIANYHTHTYRCHHASGLDEEYIKKAITEGVKILGFSDHAPFFYKNGYTSYYKMLPSEAGEYYKSLSLLKEKYRDKIDIYIGYESEYYPEIWDEAFEFWRRENSPDYLILGQHIIGEEHDLQNRVASTNPNMLVSEYVSQTIEGIKTGVFTYIAHPDLVNYIGPDEVYEEEMTRLILAAREANMPLEINMLGLIEKRNYPRDFFWEIAGRHEARVILGCDAHSPERVADRDELLMALRFAEKHRLNVVDTIELKNPFK